MEKCLKKFLGNYLACVYVNHVLDLTSGRLLGPRKRNNPSLPLPSKWVFLIQKSHFDKRFKRSIGVIRQGPATYVPRQVTHVPNSWRAFIS